MSVTSASDPKNRIRAILIGDLSASISLDDFTEVDPGAPAALSTSGKTATFQLLSQTDGLYLYKDYGAGYFGDFEFDIEFEETGSGADDTYPYRVFCCSLANALEDWNDNNGASETQVGIVYYRNTTSRYFATAESHGGSTSLSSLIAVSALTRYYLKLVRSSTTLTLYVYSNAERTTLVGSASVSCQNTTFRYLFAVQAPHNAGGTASAIGYVENLTVLGDLTTSITKDDDSTTASLIVMYETDDIPLDELFSTYDAAVLVSGPESLYSRHLQDVPVQADYDVVVAVVTLDKSGITGTIMQWKIQRTIENLVEAAAQLPDGIEVSVAGKSRTTIRRAAGKSLYTTVYAVRYGSP